MKGEVLSHLALRVYQSTGLQQAATGQKSVYYYLFRQRPPLPSGSVYEGWGASHFADPWYVFDHLDPEPWRWSAADRRVAEEMSNY